MLGWVGSQCYSAKCIQNENERDFDSRGISFDQFKF